MKIVLFLKEEIHLPNDEKLSNSLQNALDEVKKNLSCLPEIKHFQQIEEHVTHQKSLIQLENQIKDLQKQAAHLFIYQKNEAKQQVDQQIDILMKTYQNNISVNAYRQALQEANQTIQDVFSYINSGIDRILERK